MVNSSLIDSSVEGLAKVKVAHTVQRFSLCVMENLDYIITVM